MGPYCTPTARHDPSACPLSNLTHAHTRAIQSVPQERLIALVANYLVESNSAAAARAASAAAGASPGGGSPPPSAAAEFTANLERNLADALRVLPKLCTGVDVNLRFNDVRGFEFTDEVAVFDLVDVSLVHGWLADPTEVGSLF